MKKSLLIALKDLRIRITDWPGMLFLLATPLMVTTIMGFAFGGGSSGGETELRIPVAVLNLDQGLTQDDLNGEFSDQLGVPAGLSVTDFLTSTGELASASGLNNNQVPADGLNFGKMMVEQVLTTDELSKVLLTTVVSDEVAARALVLAGGDYCCLVTFPPTMTQSLLLGEKVELPIYSDPARGLSAQIVESVLRGILTQFGSGTATFQVSIEQAFASGRLGGITNLSDVLGLVRQIGEGFFPQQGQTTGQTPGETSQPTNTFRQPESLITLETLNPEGKQVAFDPFSFFVPSMAILFLGFAATQGVRSIIAEREAGTLGRLTAGPVSPTTFLFGKLAGTFVIGGLQFAVLLIAGVLLFGVRWGDPVGVTVLSFFTVLVFTGLGLLVAVIAKDQAQANTIATSITLVFGLLGGNFTSTNNYPAWLRMVAQCTPNFWGMQGFTKLGLGQSLSALSSEIAVMALMTALLFGLGIWLYQRWFAV